MQVAGVLVVYGVVLCCIIGLLMHLVNEWIVYPNVLTSVMFSQVMKDCSDQVSVCHVFAQSPIAQRILGSLIFMMNWLFFAMWIVLVAVEITNIAMDIIDPRQVVRIAHKLNAQTLFLELHLALKAHSWL
jgi:hypothetical protein